MDDPVSTASLHDSSYDEHLEVAVEAARGAGALVRDRAGTVHGVRDKGVNDFVTEVDEDAQALITECLRDGFPEIDVLAEEGTDASPPAARIEGRRWIVDPIDGTTNFIQQVPPYAVSIALQDGDRIVAGVVYDIPHDDLYTVVRGHGVQVNGSPQRTSDTTDLGDAFVATGFPYRRFEHTEAYLAVLNDVLQSTRGVRRHGAASVDLARLAAGRFDGFFETGLRPWDVAAGVLLVREAGGRVTDYRGADGLTPIFERQVCATNGPCHDALREIVSDMKDIRL
jgi:myo-inositol-1(or 4)-monophosphatase